MGAGAAAGCKRFFTRNKYEEDEDHDFDFDRMNSIRSQSSRAIVHEPEPVREPKLPELLSRHIYGNEDPFRNFPKGYFGEELSESEEQSDEDEDPQDQDQGDQLNLDGKDDMGEDGEQSQQEGDEEEDPIDEEEANRQNSLKTCDGDNLWQKPSEPQQLVTRDLHKVYKREKKADWTTQTSHEAVSANVIGGPWCRIVEKQSKVRKRHEFRAAKVEDSTRWCWNRTFVERSCLEFSAKKRGTSLPILSLESARSMAAKGGVLRRKLAKYNFVVDTEGRQCLWSDDFLQFLKVLRFHHNSADSVIEEEELMILAAENGINPDKLFPPDEEPDPNANEVVDSVHVPADLLVRRHRPAKPPPIPALPRPDSKTMFTSMLPLTMEFVRRPRQTHVEDTQEWEDWEEELQEIDAEENMSDGEMENIFDFLTSAPLEAPKPLAKEDILDITHGHTLTW